MGGFAKASSAGLILTILLFGGVRAWSEPTMASVGIGGIQGNGSSAYPSLSADGRYLVFASAASNLVLGDANQKSDIFRLDVIAGFSPPSITRVSNGLNAEANDDSDYPTVSSDGRYVVFQSTANNLVSLDGNNARDVFRKDMVAGTTVLVSSAIGGGSANGDSSWAAVSRDGRYITFASDASDIVADDTNAKRDIFRKDMSTGTVVRISVASDGTQANDASQRSTISGDGRYVLFHSDASNMVSGDTNGTRDVFLRDNVNSSTSRVSLTSSGAQAPPGASSEVGGLSADGRYLLFSAQGSFIAGVTGTSRQLYRYDTQTSTLILVSTTSGQEGNGPSGELTWNTTISDNGRYVMFDTLATNLVDNFYEKRQIAVRDTVDETTHQVSYNEHVSEAGNSDSNHPSIAAAGDIVAFASDATNLTQLDSNLSSDILVWGELDDPECRTFDGLPSAGLPVYCELWLDDALGLGETGSYAEQMQSSLGNRYAGAWIDRSVSPSAFRVGAINPTAQDSQDLATITGLSASRASIVSVQYSLTALEGYRDTIDAFFANKTYERAIGIRESVNKVSLGISQPDPLLAGQIAAAGVPANAYEIDTTFSYDDTHTSRDFWQGSYEAGLHLSPVTNLFDPHCTTGFMGYRANVTPRPYYGTTAGHCIPGVSVGTQKQVRISGKYMWSDRTTFSPNGTASTDSARYLIGTNTSEISNRIYTGGNNGHRRIVGYLSLSEMAQTGQRGCFQGIGSDNNNCGVINWKQKAYTYNSSTQGQSYTFTVTHAWAIDFPCVAGDSGGPVYRVMANLSDAKAEGIVTGKLVTNGVNSCGFSYIYYVMSAQSLVLYY